ncbi:MAG: alpha-mannosidase [Oscillospiraceae bacterium]|nr:alpha-mannosidase [Oscillospiraceae bacterium]
MKDFIEDRIRVFLEELDRLIVKTGVPQNGFLYKECGYKSGNELPQIDGTFCEFVTYKDRWAGECDKHAWFYKKVTVPESFAEGEAELSIASDATVGWADVNPQFIAYVNGKLVQGIDKNHREIFLDGPGTYEIYLYAYTGSVFPEHVDFIATLRLVDKKIKKLYYDLKVPFEILEFEDENSRNYFEIKKHINNAVNLIDMRNPYSEEFYSSIERAEEYIQNEFYGKYCREGEIHAICIGHTHIDVAWEWTLAQTREKTLRSFSTVLALMKKYPEYKFMSSQPQLYKFLMEESPELYREVKEMVKQGRWEVEGGMWIEADCNLSSGESLVRQFLYGKRFMQKEFGVESKVLWLPDVFGYSAALPQIMKKCGIDKFITSKIGWNESNKMPYDAFLWHGIDNTEIFTYFMTAQDKHRGQEPATNVTYNAKLNANQLRGAYDRFQQKELYDDVLITFGFGDGGGGPTAKDLEMYDRLKIGIPGTSTAVMGYAGDFLEDVKTKTENNPRIPHWNGELYLEFHRGTYTSQAKNKKYNRTSEFMFEKAETLSLINEYLTGAVYPKEKMQAAWETILLNQFHDIIPGSSIHEVYEVSHEQYRNIQSTGKGIIDDALEKLADGVCADNGILVYNPNSFVSSSAVKFGDGYIYAENIPPKGYKVIVPEEEKSSIMLSNNTIENKFFKLSLDDNGNFSSIFDKRNNREVLKQGAKGNVFTVYEDYPREYDNWEISSYYTEKHWDITDLQSIEPIFEGERAGLRITRKNNQSKIVQTIFVYEHIDKIDFDTFIDWKESHLVLKTAFPVDVNTNKATYDIQFGSVERPTHKNTSWDAARFEVCAHKYCDLSEYGYGVSLLNDCKYGHAIHDGVMTLTLLKCGTFPDPMADKCEHEFTYSLYPHAKDYREAGTIQKAYELNVPMTAVKVSENKGTLPCEFSLLSVDAENIIFETAKQAEDSKDIILRGYECFNKRTDVTLTLGLPVKSAYICDMLENEETEIPVTDGKISLSFKPFEIITVKLKK